MSFNKVFILGLPRTGTTSICSALLNEGLTVAHTAYTDKTFEDAQVLADTPIYCDYQALDKHYPNSKFVVLTRQPEAWLPSIKQLLLRMFVNVTRDDGGFNPIIKRSFTSIFAPFTKENIENDDFLLQCYNKHLAEIESHFNGREDDVIYVEVSNDADYSKLCDFLKIKSQHSAFPHLNIGGKVTAWSDIKDKNKIASTKNGRVTKLPYQV